MVFLMQYLSLVSYHISLLWHCKQFIRTLLLLLLYLYLLFSIIIIYSYTAINYSWRLNVDIMIIAIYIESLLSQLQAPNEHNLGKKWLKKRKITKNTIAKRIKLANLVNLVNFVLFCNCYFSYFSYFSNICQMSIINKTKKTNLEACCYHNYYRLSPWLKL